MGYPDTDEPCFFLTQKEEEDSNYSSAKKFDVRILGHHGPTWFETCPCTQESATESGGGIFYLRPVEKKDER